MENRGGDEEFRPRNAREKADIKQSHHKCGEKGCYNWTPKKYFLCSFCQNKKNKLLYGVRKTTKLIDELTKLPASKDRNLLIASLQAGKLWDKYAVAKVFASFGFHQLSQEVLAGAF